MNYLTAIQQILVRLRKLENAVIALGGNPAADYYLRPVIQYFFRRPGGIDNYLRPDGISTYIRA